MALVTYHTDADGKHYKSWSDEHGNQVAEVGPVENALISAKEALGACIKALNTAAKFKVPSLPDTQNDSYKVAALAEAAVKDANAALLSQQKPSVSHDIKEALETLKAIAWDMENMKVCETLKLNGTQIKVDYAKELLGRIEMQGGLGVSQTVHVAVRIDDSTDVIAFTNEEAANAFCQTRTEYAPYRTGVYETAAEGLDIWGDLQPQMSGMKG